MKKNVIFTMLIVFCVSTILVSMDDVSAAEPTFNWRLSHTTAPNSPYHIGAEKMASIVKEKTQGKFNISVHHTGSLGWEREVLEAMQLGTIEMSVPAINVVENFIPSYRLFNLPFTFKSVSHMKNVLASPLMEKLKKDAESKGFVVLEIGGPVFRYPMNRLRPINTPDDLKGLKMRTPGVAVMVDTYKALGANVVNTNFNELYSALQLGMVDGCENFFANLHTMKFYEVQKYLSVVPILNNTCLIAVSKKKWDTLPKDYQKILIEASAEGQKTMDSAFISMEDSSLEFMKKNGITVNTPPSLEPFINITEPVRKKYLSQMEPWVSDIATQIMNMK